MTNAESFVKQLTETLQGHIDADALHKVWAAVESLYFSEIPPCLAKADVNEPVFVLRAQDESAYHTVRDWISRNAGKTPFPKLRAADDVATAMRSWPNRKQPD